MSMKQSECPIPNLATAAAPANEESQLPDEGRGENAAENPDETTPGSAADGVRPGPEALKRSLRAVAQERNEARARVRHLESELETNRRQAAELQCRIAELEQELSGAPAPDELGLARARIERMSGELDSLKGELTRYRLERPLLDALVRHQCADPGDALTLVKEHVRMEEDGKVRFFDPWRPERALTHEDGTSFNFDDFATYVLRRKPHLCLRPPAIGSGAPDGVAAEAGLTRPDSRRDPEAYRRYFVRRFGKDPRSLISL